MAELESEMAWLARVYWLLGQHQVTVHVAHQMVDLAIDIVLPPSLAEELSQ